MKYSFYLGLLIVFASGCIFQTEYNTSVLMSKIETKAYLLENGFRPSHFHKPLPTKDNIFNTVEVPNENLLVKKIKDTTVAYSFYHGTLLIIGLSITLKHADSSSVFKLLTSLGFDRMSANNGIIVFNNKKEGIHYDITCDPHHMNLTNVVSVFHPPLNEPRPDSVVILPPGPKRDSIRARISSRK